jgi:hypothetical protein
MTVEQNLLPFTEPKCPVLWSKKLVTGTYTERYETCGLDGGEKVQTDVF